jgi:hypothetical protein
VDLALVPVWEILTGPSYRVVDGLAVEIMAVVVTSVAAGILAAVATSVAVVTNSPTIIFL